MSSVLPDPDAKLQGGGACGSYAELLARGYVDAGEVDVVGGRGCVGDGEGRGEDYLSAATSRGRGSIGSGNELEGRGCGGCGCDVPATDVDGFTGYTADG